MHHSLINCLQIYLPPPHTPIHKGQKPLQFSVKFTSDCEQRWSGFFFWWGGGFNFSPSGPVALDFSLQLLWLCGGQASQGGGFSCGSWALGMWTSVQCSWRASLSPSVWNPPRPGVESVSPALTGRFLATGLPRDGPPPPFNRAIHSPSSTWSHRYSLPQDSCVFYQNFTFISLDSICSNIL